MSLGHTRIYINVGRSHRANTPLGRDARVRRAFNLAIDREALNKVIFEGQNVPASSWIPPGNTFDMKTVPVLRRDVAARKGAPRRSGSSQSEGRAFAAKCACAVTGRRDDSGDDKEAGFETRLLALEVGTAIQKADRGEYEALLALWPGFADPDMNIFGMLACKGALNYGGYCNAEVDRLLEEARAHSSVDERFVSIRPSVNCFLVMSPTFFCITRGGSGLIAQSSRALSHTRRDHARDGLTP